MRDNVRLALARQVPSTLASGLLAPGVSPSSVDINLATAQHADYVSILREHCTEVLVLPEASEFPDSVFVEDAAVVLGRRALQGVPGHATRAGEAALLAPSLRAAGVDLVTTNARIDGGDVLYAAGRFFVGMSKRTDASAVHALHDRFGVDVVPIDVFGGVLHLKCVVTWVRGAQLLIAQDCPVGHAVVEQMMRSVNEVFNVAWVPKTAKGGANVLDLGDVVCIQQSDWELVAGLRDKLEAGGVRPVACDMSELAKANGALTCCSILDWS